MKSPRNVFSLFGLALLAGCAIHADVPDRFLKLKNTRFEFKATSADDAMFWVRRFDGQEKDSNLDFWQEALTNNLVKGRGYTLVDSSEITTRSGLAGRAMVLEATVGGETQRELFAIFQKERLWGGPSLYVAEYVAPKTLFDEYLDRVRAAIESLDL
ncbi:MAG: hypothetical protein ACYTGW_12820 [Planctomycetota bacterium]|jgi:hypothetical protein